MSSTLEFDPGYFFMPDRIAQMGLGPHKLAILANLYRRANTNAIAFPSYERIGQDVGMSRSTVAKHVEDLCRGWETTDGRVFHPVIEKIRTRTEEGRQGANRFRLPDARVRQPDSGVKNQNPSQSPGAGHEGQPRRTSSTTNQMTPDVDGGAGRLVGEDSHIWEQFLEEARKQRSLKQPVRWVEKQRETYKTPDEVPGLDWWPPEKPPRAWSSTDEQLAYTEKAEREKAQHGAVWAACARYPRTVAVCTCETEGWE